MELRSSFFAFDLLNIGLGLGFHKRANLDLLTFNSPFGRSLLRVTLNKFNGNPVSNVEIHLFWIIIYSREVSYKSDTDSYKIKKSGLFV